MRRNKHPKGSISYIEIREIIREELKHFSEENSRDKNIFSKIFLFIASCIFSLIGLVTVIAVLRVAINNNWETISSTIVMLIVGILIFVFYLISSIKIARKKPSKKHSQLLYYIFSFIGTLSSLYFLYNFFLEIGFIGG